MIDKSFVQKCQAFIEPNRFRLDEPMKLHTTFKIGGPADCLIFPASMEETEKVLALVSEYKLPLTILGNGSNVLVQDKGIRGVVVKFARPMAKIRHEGTRIIAGAGALLKDVSEAAAYDGEMKNVADTVRTVDREGRIHTYSRDELDLGYRHSRFQDNGEAIVEVELCLEPGDSKAIRAKMDDFTQRRESKQPLEMPSAGSTFKRPKGYFAGTLIQETGLKGLQVGGAQVSTKHAGFVVNATGNATAADVRGLIHEVQQRVYEKHGVMLHPEVRIIGDA